MLLALALFNFIISGFAHEKNCLAISASERSFIYDPAYEAINEINIRNYSIRTKGHSDQIIAMKYSPDGSMLATSSLDNTIKVWMSVREGRIFYNLRGHYYKANGIVFTADNKKLLSSSYDGGTVILWTITHDKKEESIKEEKRIEVPGVLSIAASPCNKLFVVGTEKRLEIYSLSSLSIVKAFNTNHPVTSVAYSPNCEYIVYISNGRVYVLNNTNNNITTVNLETAVTWAEFHPEYSLRLFLKDLQNNIYIWFLRYNNGTIMYSGIDKFAFDVEGSIISTRPVNPEFFNNANVRDLKDLYNIHRSVDIIVINPKVKSEIGMAVRNKIFTYTLETPIKRKFTFGTDNWRVSKVISKPTDSSIIALAFEFQRGLIGFLNIRTKENSMIRDSSNTNGVFSIAYSKDGKYFATGAENGTVKIYDSSRENWANKTVVYEPIRRVPTWPSHHGKVYTLVFSPNSSILASGGNDGVVKITTLIGQPESWELQSQNVLKHTKAVKVLCFSRDGRFLVSGSDDHEIKIWDTQSEDQLFSLTNHTQSVTGVAFNQNGDTLVSVSLDGKIIWWNVNTKSIKIEQNIKVPFQALIIDEANQDIVTADANESLSFWDWNGELLKKTKINIGDNKYNINVGDMSSLDFIPCGALRLSSILVIFLLKFVVYFMLF